jgi:threonine/homoserine/homoserine lactone efflux protein
MTVAGTSTAMVLQLALAVAGLSGALAIAASVFEVLKWAGVLYLLYLALQAWRAPPPELALAPEPRLARDIFMRGFLVSITKTKTLLFYAAFLPQFVPAGGDPQSALLVLAVTFLALAVALDSCWAVLGDRARHGLDRGGRWLNRSTSGILVLAAAMVAMARKP